MSERTPPPEGLPSKIWILYYPVIYGRRSSGVEWKHIAANDQRIDWSRRIERSGAVWFKPRANGKQHFYVSWGATKQDACNMENTYRIAEVDKLKEQIAELQATMITVDS